MAELVESGRDPLLILVDFAFDPELDVSIRLQAATAATGYLHPKLSAQAIQATTLSATVDSKQLLSALTDRLDRLVAPGPALNAVKA